MSGTVNAHSVAKSMEKAGFFVIESAVSASTLWGIKEGKLTLSKKASSLWWILWAKRRSLLFP